jgi:hypothetical protein
MTYGELNGKQYSSRHGGPFDRGSADSYYGRPRQPHYYVNGTATSTMLEEVDMSEEEVAAYHAGYQWNEDFGDKKNWD